MLNATAQRWEPTSKYNAFWYGHTLIPFFQWYFSCFQYFGAPISKQARLELNYIVYEPQTPPVVFKLDSNCS